MSKRKAWDALSGEMQADIRALIASGMTTGAAIYKNGEAIFRSNDELPANFENWRRYSVKAKDEKPTYQPPFVGVVPRWQPKNNGRDH